MRVFMACLDTETNTFAPFPTSLSAFEPDGIVRDGSLRPNTGLAVVLQTLRRLAQAAGVGREAASAPRGQMRIRGSAG